MVCLFADLCVPCVSPYVGMGSHMEEVLRGVIYLMSLNPKLLGKLVV